MIEGLSRGSAMRTRGERRSSNAMSEITSLSLEPGACVEVGCETVRQPRCAWIALALRRGCALHHKQRLCLEASRCEPGAKRSSNAADKTTSLSRWSEEHLSRLDAGQ